MEDSVDQSPTESPDWNAREEHRKQSSTLAGTSISTCLHVSGSGANRIVGTLVIDSRSSGGPRDSTDQDEAETFDSGAAHDDESVAVTNENSVRNNTENHDVLVMDPEEVEAARRIFIARILFSIALVLSTIGIACAVFYFVRAAQTSEFEFQYERDANRLKESIGLAFRSTMTSADSLAANYLAVQCNIPICVPSQLCIPSGQDEGNG